MSLRHRTLIPCLGLLVAAALAGCAGSLEEPCPGCDIYPGAPEDDPVDPSVTPGPTAPAPSCTSDASCTPPYVCNLKVNKCVPPSAKENGPCDPVEGQSCPAGQQCIAGICMSPPGGCVTNENCPVGYLCTGGTCVPDGGGGQPGCASNSQCPGGQVCIGGTCKPKEVCTVPHATDRMAGTFRLDSQLHVRDGLQGFTKGLLGLAGTLQKIIDGKFSISGVPSFFSSIIGSLLQGMIKQYVPAWGTSVIALLADVNDVIDDTHVVSLEQVQALGGDMYVGSSTWQLVEFEYKGAKVSTAPDAIPGLGKVTTESYSAREVCGVFYMDQHKVKNAIGKVFRWAVEAAITGVSCTMEGGPCYTDIPTMFNNLIDCNGLGASMGSANGQISGLEALVVAACFAQKQTFINLIVKELESLELNLTYMTLAGKADIASASQLINGRWYGALGSGYSKGNFEGTFTGVRQ